MFMPHNSTNNPFNHLEKQHKLRYDECMKADAEVGPPNPCPCPAPTQTTITAHHVHLSLKDTN